MEPSRDKRREKGGWGFAEGEQTDSGGGRGVLSEGMSKRWRMEIGLDREKRRGGVAILPSILGSGTWQRAC